MAAHNAYAATSPTLRESHDCPIAKPFTPKPEHTDSAKKNVLYSMDGYKISRLEISSNRPLNLEIIWTPVDAMWGQQAAQVLVNSESAQCFLSSFPFNTPAKQIEIRSSESIENLAVSFSDVPWDHEGTCIAKKECPNFLNAMNACKADPTQTSCRNFLDILHQLTSRMQCRRTFDTSPVPAIWLCDDIVKHGNTMPDTLGDAMHLLKSLKFKEAKDYYKSYEFRGVLDGDYAEEHDGL